MCVADQGDVVVADRGPYGDDVGVGLGLDQAGEAVAGRAPDAGAQLRLGLVEHDPGRRVERMQPDRPEVVEEPLDAGLVRDGRERVGSAGRRLGGVFTARAVDLVEVLGLGVVGLEHVVPDRPGRRDPIVVLQFPEVPLAQSIERRAVELGRPADGVVDLRLECLAVLVVPGVIRDVAVVHEHRSRVPVLGLAGQPVAAFEDQHPLPGRCQPVRERAAPGPGADDDDVVLSVMTLLGSRCGAHRAHRARVSTAPGTRRSASVVGPATFAGHRPGLLCMIPPSAKIVAAVM